MAEIIKSFFKKGTSIICAFSVFFCFIFSGCTLKKEESDHSAEDNADAPVFREIPTQSTTTVPYSSPEFETTTAAAMQAAKKKPQRTTTTVPTTEFNPVFDDPAALDDYLKKKEGPDNRLIKWYVDVNGNITTEGDKGILGFGYSMKENCFYATGNAWQRNFGYTELYDKVSELIVISYDTIRIYFTYNNKDWMIQLWKGQYGLVLLGAEVGVYNRPRGINITSFYNCAKDNERLPISLSLYSMGRQKFSRKAQDSWWMTGFVPGQLGLGVAVGSPLTRLLTATTTITLEDEEMFNAFIKGLKNVKSIFNNVDYAANVSGGRLFPGERPYHFEEGSGTYATRFKGTYKTDGYSVTITWK